MKKEIEILRDLAKQYAEIAADRVNEERIKLYKGVNDLKQIRPVVLIDEVPWNEMHIGDELINVNHDREIGEIEWYMRTALYKWKYMPADMVVTPFVPIVKMIHSTGIGIDVKEKTLSTDNENYIVSHQYFDQLSTQEDVDKLCAPVITYLEEETKRKYEKIANLIGDIIPVKIVGHHIGAATWDDISRYRGVERLLMDLIERPEFTHSLVRKLTDIKKDIFIQYEDLNLWSDDYFTVHCTPAASDELPSKSFDGKHVKMKDVWGRGTAQIFASVSPQMHEEFDIDYMKELMDPFGLVYYGCCEPLHNKIDILEKISNLRKISITPWADVEVAAECIGKKYVLSSKANPASVAVKHIDKNDVRKELKKILDACRKNGCAVDITLKDISSVGHDPENLFTWEKIAMDLIENY